ncbi:hypothetical protein Gotur_025739 [Gossypium turneri]
MGNEFLDRVEDNAAVRTWAEITQREKGDSLAEGYVSELWDFTCVSVTQNNLQEVDLVPTMEEYTALLRCSRIQVDKVYSKAVNAPNFLKRLVSITGMSEQWVTARIKQKGDGKCIPWKNLKDLILAHPDAKKKVDIFALSIYGLVVFPRALGHVDEAVTDLFDQLDKRVTPFHGHFWKVDKVSYHVFSNNYSPLKEIVATPRRDDISEEKWMAIFQNLQEEDIEWRAPWLLPDEILYQCRDFDWGLAECEFSYKGDGYKKRIREMVSAWIQTRRMKRLAVGPMTIPEYSEWWVRRINDNIPRPGSENSQSIEEYLRVVPTELEIIKQNFKRKNEELEKKIEQIEEEKVNLRLDVDVQKLEADKLRKGKNKAEEELDSLKTDYKKLRLSMRTAGLGKTSEQWREEIREERNRSDRWERKFQEVQTRNEALEKSLSESQKEKGELKDRVVELEGSLCQHRSRNSVIELKSSLSKIEEMKGKIEELEQHCEVVRNSDHVMGEAVVQIREVADHLQTLAV